jgi:hypothetical protein
MDDDFITQHVRHGRKWEGSLCFLYYRDYVNVARLKLRVPEETETLWLGQNRGELGFLGLSCFRHRRESSTLLVEGEFDVLVPLAFALMVSDQTINVLCRFGGAMRDQRNLTKLAGWGITHGYILPDYNQGGLEFVEGLLAQADGQLDLLVVWPPTTRSERIQRRWAVASSPSAPLGLRCRLSGICRGTGWPAVLP